MADISKITLPNGSSYDIKDSVARSGLAGKAASLHTHTKSQITDFPSSLPANGGNADTVDGYHIRCEDVATPNYNWFATFDNDGLSGINPQRAYVGNAGLLKPTLIGTDESCQYKTILDWANSVNGMGQAHTVAAGGFPSDTPVDDEGLITVETDIYNSRKVVTFKSYGSGHGTYRRNIWSGEWRWGWIDLFSEKPYVTGRISASYNTAQQSFTCLDFTPSAVICKHPEKYANDGRITWATPITNGFSVTINDTTATYVDYIAFK